MLVALVLVPLGALAVSAAAKVRSRAAFTGFAAATADLGRLPARLAAPAATAVVLAEAVLAAALTGALLAPRVLAAPALAGAAVMFAAFAAVLARALAGGTAAACHCFGPSRARVARRHVIRAGVLAVEAATAGAGAVSAPDLLDPAGGSAAGLLVNGCSAVAAVAAVVHLDTLAWLLRRPGQPRRPLEEP
ncbi:MauE/DoxX family redox-associated membrane protein [Dactylosporangium sp. CA-152071]|uniref:MauE/DoxX family redox-associated membrane protein n=1 Tax=Dactylosporangium sp. CA-152071 TaxID=3239933 RepID=UPI003D91754D